MIRYHNSVLLSQSQLTKKWQLDGYYRQHTENIKKEILSRMHRAPGLEDIEKALEKVTTSS